MGRHDWRRAQLIDLHTRAGAQFPCKTKYLVRGFGRRIAARFAQRVAVECGLAFAAGFAAATAWGELAGDRSSTALSVTYTQKAVQGRRVRTRSVRQSRKAML